jgi:SAM-dependent methyltransferase
MTAQALRTIFDEAPELYAAARPGYPAELIADLARLASIGPGTRVVEIGPGTGQATTAIAALGASITAVELGPGLAEVLRRNVMDAPVELVVTAFEDWPLPPHAVDVVVAFTAWHWLDPAVRTAKAAALLRHGGTLATVSTSHVDGGTREFFRQAQNCYERWDPATPSGLTLPEPEDVAPTRDEVDQSDWFGPPVLHRYHQQITYTTGDYLKLLATYSGHRALQTQRRADLFSCLADIIDNMHGGTITKQYLHELRLAPRRADR